MSTGDRQIIDNGWKTNPHFCRVALPRWIKLLVLLGMRHAACAGMAFGLTLVLCAAQPAFAAITVDNATSTTSSGASVSFSHTVGAGSNRILIVGMSIDQNTTVNAISGVSYGGTALTRIGDTAGTTNTVRISLWRLINPASGSANVVVSSNVTNKDIVVGAISYFGVNQTTPLGSFASAIAGSGSPTVNVSSATNDLVIDVVAVGGALLGNSISVGAGQTQRYNVSTAGILGGGIIGAGSGEAGAATTTMSWAQNGLLNGPWAIGAVPLKPAPPTISKAFSPATIASFQTSQLTFTITNPNPGLALTGMTFTDVFPTSPGSMTLANTSVANTCGGTLTNFGGGALNAGDIGIQFSGGTIAAATGSCTITVNVTAAVAGAYNNTSSAVGSTNSGTGGTASATLIVALPSLTVAKTVLLVSDPINGAANPKAIPGAIVMYSIQVTNSGAGTADNNTTVIDDPIPTNSTLFVGDLGSAGSGPVAFVDGTPPAASGLTYTFTSLANGADDVSFSNIAGCATFTYTPVPDINGFDASVTCIRINPKGLFAAASGGNNPNFQVRFRVRVN